MGKGLVTSLALQCYAGYVGSVFPCKVASEMTTGDKGKLFHSLHSFIHSHPIQQDCVFPVLA